MNRDLLASPDQVGQRAPSPPTHGTTLRWVASARTMIGNRPTNQDRYWSSETLLAVADGVGGQPGGNLAAEAAIAALAMAWRSAQPDPVQLIAAVDAAHEAVLDRALEPRHPTEMATTLCAVGLGAGPDGQPTVTIVSIGNTRVYVRKPGTRVAVALTEDHTLANEDLAPPHDAPPMAHHVLTRSIGLRSRFDPDVLTIPAVTGDRYLVCSDGVHASVDAAGISTALTANEQPAGAARDLVSQALAHRTRDNATAVVADIAPARSTSRESPALWNPGG